MGKDEWINVINQMSKGNLYIPTVLPQITEEQYSSLVKHAVNDLIHKWGVEEIVRFINYWGKAVIKDVEYPKKVVFNDAHLIYVKKTPEEIEFGIQLVFFMSPIDYDNISVGLGKNNRDFIVDLTNLIKEGKVKLISKHTHAKKKKK